ncbi:MAG: hypothetical protein K0S00_1261 [Xanthobacteraceae bacterium]|nr:hypothetical protein [Xanthobacteraceae bacterium]
MTPDHNGIINHTLRNLGLPTGGILSSFDAICLFNYGGDISISGFLQPPLSRFGETNNSLIRNMYVNGHG